MSCLLLVDSPDLPEDVVMPKVGCPYSTSKTALHFPLDMFESAQWIKICLMTEQEASYCLVFEKKKSLFVYFFFCRSFSIFAIPLRRLVE